MPAGLIHENHRMGLGQDRLGELVEHRLHGGRKDHGQGERHCFLAHRADRAEEIERLMTEIAQPPWPNALLVPAAAGAAGLTGPGFILEPDLDPLSVGMGIGDVGDQALEDFWTPPAPPGRPWDERAWSFAWTEQGCAAVSACCSARRTGRPC